MKTIYNYPQFCDYNDLPVVNIDLEENNTGDFIYSNPFLLWTANGNYLAKVRADGESDDHQFWLDLELPPFTLLDDDVGFHFDTITELNNMKNYQRTEGNYQKIVVTFTNKKLKTAYPPVVLTIDLDTLKFDEHTELGSCKFLGNDNDARFYLFLAEVTVLDLD